MLCYSQEFDVEKNALISSTVVNPYFRAPSLVRRRSLGFGPHHEYGVEPFQESCNRNNKKFDSCS